MLSGSVLGLPTLPDYVDQVLELSMSPARQAK